MVTVKLSTSLQSQEAWLRQIWSHYLCVMEEVLHVGTTGCDHERYKQEVQTKCRPLPEDLNPGNNCL